MSEQVIVPNTVYDTAKDVKQERDFSSLGEAIRHMAQEGGYDV